MGNKYSTRTFAWLITLSWLILIYSTLYIARPISNFLRKNGLLEFCVIFLILSILLGLVYSLIRKCKIKHTSSIAMLFFIFLCYGAGLVYLEFPEEKLHFVQYGVLACLLFISLRFDFSEVDSYIGAFVLNICFGWLDEGIQYLLPNRVYDIQDVYLNAISGFLGLCLLFVLRKEIGIKNPNP